MPRIRSRPGGPRPSAKEKVRPDFGKLIPCKFGCRNGAATVGTRSTSRQEICQKESREGTPTITPARRAGAQGSATPGDEGMKRRAGPPKHTQVEIEVRGKKIQVDRGIAALVEALSKLPGVETAASCENQETGLAFANFGVSDAQGRQADDATVCRLLRRIETALNQSRVWARITLDFTQDYPQCQIECDPANVIRVAKAIERMAGQPRGSAPC
jgi:hypothetical protein